MKKTLPIALTLASLISFYACKGSDELPRPPKNEELVLKIQFDDNHTNDNNTYQYFSYSANIWYPLYGTHIISDFIKNISVPDTAYYTFPKSVKGSIFECTIAIGDNKEDYSTIISRNYHLQPVILDGEEDTITIHFPKDTINSTEIYYSVRQFPIVNSFK